MAKKTIADIFVSYNNILDNKPKQEELLISQAPDFGKLTMWDNYIDFLKERTSNKEKSKEEPKEEPKEEESEVVSVYDNLVEYNPWTVLGDAKITKARKISNKKGYEKFLSLLEEYFTKNPNDAKYKDMLTNLAAFESSFTLDSVNSSSKALGYFLFIESTRLHYTNTSRQEFANDAQELIRAAIAYLKDLKADVQRNVSKENIEKSKLTPLLIIYGMWWRPRTMRNYLNGIEDNYSTTDGMNIKKIIKKAS